MRGADLRAVDPLRVRSLSLRKRSLLRKYAASPSSNSSHGDDNFLAEQKSAQRYVHFVKTKAKKRKGRRAVRFAPMVDVYEVTLPEDFMDEEFEALWIGKEDYENAKQEFSSVLLAIQTEDLDVADLLIPEDELPHNHPFRKHCMRGCEKYFDLPTRFRIRQVIAEKVLEFYRSMPDDPQALAVFCAALSAECSDLAYFHGKLNALQVWGTMLQKYKNMRQDFSRSILSYSVTFHEAGKVSSCNGIEVVLDPSAATGSRALLAYDAWALNESIWCVK